MNARLPWFKCTPEKLLGALAAMTTDEGYIYIQIILRIYEVGGPISDPVRALARRSGMTERRANVALGLLIESGKVNFTNDGKIDSVTTHEALDEMAEFREAQSRAAKIGSEKRAEKRKQKQQNDSADAVPPLSQLRIENKDLDKSKSILCAEAHDAPEPEKKKRTKVTPTEIDAKFEEFRAAYPTRAGDLGLKQAKEKLRAALAKGVQFEEIMTAARRYRRNVSERGKDGTEFVKQMPAWFNAQPWLENALAPVSSAPSDATDWRPILEMFCKSQTWQWGRLSPEPGAPGCKIPAEIIAEYADRMPASPLAGMGPARRLSLVPSQSERAA